MSEQTAVPASPPPPPPKPLSLGETLAKRKAELEQVIVAAQTDLAAVEAKIAAIPAEFHDLTHLDLISKIKAWFEG